jgi:hypothetical protein
MYSGPETQDDSQANYRERTVRIGDRSGVQLVTYETTSSPTVFVARTFFPAVKSAGPTLSLLAQCQNADGRELALTVLQTVQFQ